MFKRPYKTLNKITIHSNALVHNYDYFSKLNPTAKIAPVIKSNAYGHGLIQVAKIVDQKINPPFICVDSLYEAYELTKKHIKTPILILGYTDKSNFHIWKQLHFSFSVFDKETLHHLAKFQPKAKIHIKLDTGMCRLGVTPNQIDAFIAELKQYPHLKVEGIYSHLSQADDLNKKSFSNNQIKLFKKMASRFERAGFHFKWRHIAATSGASWIHDPYFNLIRLGIGFYGISPFSQKTSLGKEQRKKLQPALTFTTHIAQVKTIEPNSQVSYGGTYTSDKRETIAILPIGYNEGLSRSLSNRGMVLLENKREAKIVGNICMNMTIIKIPKGVEVKRGDRVTIISDNPEDKMSVDTLAQKANTIPYTILTGMHPSTKRDTE